MLPKKEKQEPYFYWDDSALGNREVMAASACKKRTKQARQPRKPLYDNPNNIHDTQLTHVRCNHCGNTGLVDLSDSNINHGICPDCYYENGLVPV